MALNLDGDWERGSVEARVAGAMDVAEEFARYLVLVPEEHRQMVIDHFRQVLQEEQQEQAAQQQPAAA